MKAVNIQLPDEMDAYFEGIARSRLTSKASICREILLEHVRRKAPQVLPQDLREQPQPEPAAA
jgi:predicted transcriptional regulator